jgi:hypothetical protein
MSVKAFRVQGNTIAISASNIASTPVQIQNVFAPGSNRFRVINSGTVIVFLSFGDTAAAATTNCVIPVPGTPRNCIPLLPGTDEILTFTQNIYFATITSSGTATVYITPGNGM